MKATQKIAKAIAEKYEVLFTYSDDQNQVYFNFSERIADQFGEEIINPKALAIEAEMLECGFAGALLQSEVEEVDYHTLAFSTEGINLDEIKVLELLKSELVEQVIDLLPVALSGDPVNRTFYFEVKNDQIKVDYVGYLGQRASNAKDFFTVLDYQIPNPEEYGYDTIGEMDFDACGYSDYILEKIDQQLAFSQTFR